MKNYSSEKSDNKNNQPEETRRGKKKYIGGLNLENQSCLGGRLTVAPLVQ